ncbi:mitotic deacetylase associated SANT domain protein a isoform X1 [Osmerus eperlanus]|uniref:mitotic deacetylase associated SANT domain protein a isoform X1 n=1 Tax=Osmerus eperlanus TaxID=29151 RepID=UPI002E12D58B
MSLPPQQKLNTDKGVKQRATAVKEPMQHAGDVFYGMGLPALDSTDMDSGGSTAVFNPEKGPQGRVHYQSTAKWMHQDPTQAPGWSQEAPLQTWGQNFGSYMGGMNNIRTQMAFPKGGHDGGALQIGGEKQAPGSLEVYREAAQAQARGLEWEHANAAMRQAHLQAFQQGHKGVDVQAQPHMPGSMLQPFQLAFGPTKQHLPSAYYQVYQGNKGMPNLSYSDPPKTQHQMLQLQQQMQQHQIQQQQQQQQLQQQHHHQQQQHQQLQHQIQQQQMQKQQLQQMQQYRQQQMQEQRQQAHQLQQQQQPHHLPQQEVPQPQLQQKRHQNQHFMSYQSPESCRSSTSPPPQNDNVQLLDTQEQAIETENQFSDSSVTSDSIPQKVSPNSAEPSDAPQVLPRRSRRLSRDGLSPLGGPPTMAPCTQASRELLAPQNGQVAGGGEGVNAGEAQAAAGGVIQSTRRRRRASKEINLETLAQKASEMEPAKMAKQEDGAHGRQPGMVPLVIPVSVPVGQTDSWHHSCTAQRDPFPPQPEQPSVIVARRRSLRNSLSDSFGQDAESDAGQDDDGKLSKSKRRPRPEPLFIPPPKPVTFIAPSVYSSITPYQSHLRSPICMLEHPFVLPPYTPPPILSPVRDGSGLYFSTFLSSIAAGNQSLPPPPPPKSTSRSLLRSCSSDITPPVLPLITDPTPVSFEPRINIGLQYQAEVPELCERCLPQMDQPKADLVWVPMEKLHTKHVEQHRLDDWMNLACSSVFYGGGTNQELALHCLHECGGDVLEALALLLFKEPVFSEGHHLADYHYSGSDSWTPAEKRYFNKGISAYRKDFFMVQKLVQTKSVTQCVEFYYTFKKQVKIGRNGSLTYGPPESPAEKITEATVDVKSSQHPMLTHQEGDSRKWEGSCEQSQDGTVVSDTLQAHENTGMVVVLKERGLVNKVSSQSPPPCKPRPESAGKKRRAPPKPPQEPEGVFPCKKCTRVFYKVKSRSAHMKSHAEQEKKAAALRLKEEEEARVRVATEEARMREATDEARVREATLREAAEEGQTRGGVREAERPEASSREESSEAEDEDDEDWH